MNRSSKSRFRVGQPVRIMGNHQLHEVSLVKEVIDPFDNAPVFLYRLVPVTPGLFRGSCWIGESLMERG